MTDLGLYCLIGFSVFLLFLVLIAFAQAWYGAKVSDTEAIRLKKELVEEKEKNEKLEKVAHIVRMQLALKDWGNYDYTEEWTERFKAVAYDSEEVMWQIDSELRELLDMPYKKKD